MDLSKLFKKKKKKLYSYDKIVMSYDSSTKACKLYINGELYGTLTQNVALPRKSPMLIIGNGFSTSAERFFRGKIDNFMLFSKALADTEVYSIYQSNGDCTL